MKRIGISVSILFTAAVIIFFSSIRCDALVFNDVANGNWNDGATWGNTSPGVAGTDYPGAGDDATIDSNSVTLTADAAGNNITIASGGTLTAQSYTITVSGNWDSSGGTWNPNSSTVILTGTGTIAQAVSIPWSYGFNNLSVAAANKTTTLTSATLWINKLTTGSGIFTDGANSYSVYLQGSGNVFVDGGATLTVDTLAYRANASTQNIAGRDYTGITNLLFYGVGGTDGTNSYAMQGNITANNIKIYSNNHLTGHNRPSVLSSNNYSITVTNMEIGKSDWPAFYGQLNAGASTVTVNGAVTIYPSDANGANSIAASTSQWTVSGNWTNNDTFTAGTSTVAFNKSSSTQTLNSGSSNFYNLIHSGAGTLQLTSNNLTVTSMFTNSSGAFDANSLTTTVTGLTTVSGGEYQAKTGAQTFNGGLTISGGIFTCAGGAVGVTGDMTLSSGTITGSSSTITVSGNWNATGGTINYGTSTLKMTGADKTLTYQGSWSTPQIYNLTIGTGASVTCVKGAGSMAMVVANDIILQDNASFTTFSHFLMLTASWGATAGNLTLGTGATLTISVSFVRVINDSSPHISTTGTITGAGYFEFIVDTGSTAAPVTARTYDCDVAVGSYALTDVGVLGGGTSLDLGAHRLHIVEKNQNFSSYAVLDNSVNNIPVTAGEVVVGRPGWPGWAAKLTSGSETWDVSGNVTINASDASNTNELDAGSSTWNVGGNWTNNDTFTAGTSTVTLDGTNQSISGSTTFNNLTKTVTTARTLTFGASSTTTITGTATLQGASGQLLSLRSSTPGTRWNFTLNSGASKTIAYVDVQDSDASASDSSLKPVNPSNSSSSGNNIDWFPYTPDAMIKLSAEGDGSYLTDDVYESTASAQVKSDGAVSGSTAAYTIRFENDSAESDDLIITGTGDGPGFTVQYLDDTATDRTTDVTGAGYMISSVASGASKVWTLNVTPDGDPSPVAGGTSYDVSVTAASSNDGAKTDQVKAATSSTSANLTLSKNADKETAAPGDEITYSLTASNGSGLTDASSIVLIDTVPTYTGFKIGSAAFNAGTSTLTASISYSNDSGSTWTYTPSSEACSAPSEYDYCVTNIKWSMTGDMPEDTSFSTEFVVRVQ